VGADPISLFQAEIILELVKTVENGFLGRKPVKFL
jgi:hypothetical protein